MRRIVWIRSSVNEVRFLNAPDLLDPSSAIELMSVAVPEFVGPEFGEWSHVINCPGVFGSGIRWMKNEPMFLNAPAPGFLDPESGEWINVPRCPVHFWIRNSVNELMSSNVPDFFGSGIRWMNQRTYISRDFWIRNSVSEWMSLNVPEYLAPDFGEWSNVPKCPGLVGSGFRRLN